MERDGFFVGFLLCAVACLAGIAENKGLTVHASFYGRVRFMCTHLDLVESAVVLLAAMVSALSHGTFDAAICVVLIHFSNPSLIILKSLDFNYNYCQRTAILCNEKEEFEY